MKLYSTLLKAQEAGNSEMSDVSLIYLNILYQISLLLVTLFWLYFC